MTAVAPSVPGAPTRVRIAITSPEILAQIRQVFAGKNLAVDIVRAPYVEVAVRPTGVTAPARVPAGGSVPRRLRAAYRLNVVEVETPAAATAPAVTLSRRQHEVMTLVSAGLRNQEIAARLGVSEKTVKNHINRIFRSLGVTSRVEAVLRWQRHPRATPPPALAETP